MSKILIIAEKPSVATDLARVLGKKLGKFTKDKSAVYFENDQAIITSAVGHLLEQKMPMTAAGKSLPWNFSCLPAIPEVFELEPIDKSADRLRKVLSLAKKKDVTEIVNACDAGREGELIFMNIVRYAQWKKPIKRLWMQSMTDDAILKAWDSLRSEEQMKPLADAAACRSESDWLVGLNSTRALTILKSRGGFSITPAGRVQTPTLAILSHRELEIQKFIPEPYSEVHATFTAKAGAYVGKWIDLAWKKSDAAPHARAERIWDPEAAVAIRQRCEGKSAETSEEKKPVSLVAPMLFDLTSLQREASNKFGFSARRTLQLAQECYEKHKVLTYPRTDSKCLPEDYIKTVYGIMGSLGDASWDLASFAKEILEKKSIKPNKRIFDNSKVSDHFAIIPTGKIVSLTGDAEKIFRLVTQRFMAIFFPSAVFEDTRRITRITHSASLVDAFLTTGRILVEPGWQAVYGRTPGSNGKEDLVPVEAKETVLTKSLEILELMTRPPARYNEATLLSAMEGAGKLVEDDELSAAMGERGLGTPATRASIIEGLITQKYIAREGRDFIATSRGIELIDLLQKIGLETLTSPTLTGEWEYRLKQMEQAKLPRAKFMADIIHLTRDIVESIKKYQTHMQETELHELDLVCPECKERGLRNTHDAVSCRSCKFTIRKQLASRELSDEELSMLITTGKTPLLEGFRSRFGKPFSAELVIDEKFRAKFHFPDAENAAAEDLSKAISQGSFPVKGKEPVEVLETEKFWRIPGMKVGKDEKGISISRSILSQVISLSQVGKLLGEGKSDLLKGFISQRTKRSFEAYLVLDFKTGKVNFEFPPRERKERPAKKKAEPKIVAKEEKKAPVKKAAPKKASPKKK